ncbi:hypothetical protein [Roseovarius sp. 217]|nr:hypothetical protein [Roseovarius sp. 217]EAQ25582.1 hypothetical protein ROS217_07480 [Roseovarius sp. 217]
MSEIEIIADGGLRRRWSAAQTLMERFKTETAPEGAVVYTLMDLPSF